MIFAFRNVTTLDVPLAFNDPGDTQQHTVTIRQLNPRQLEAAAKEMQRAAFADMRALGGIAVFQEEMKALKKDAKDEDKSDPDPLVLYDRAVLIEKGVKDWSFVEPLKAESIAELSLELQTFLATEILRLTRPALVLPKGEVEADRKNA